MGVRRADQTFYLYAGVYDLDVFLKDGLSHLFARELCHSLPSSGVLRGTVAVVQDELTRSLLNIEGTIDPGGGHKV